MDLGPTGQVADADAERTPDTPRAAARPRPVSLRGGLRHRRRLLLVVLAVLRLPWREPEPEVVGALRRWLGGWPGIGRVTVGMARQGYDLQLTRYGTAGWRATFFAAGREHAITDAVGSAWAPTPGGAVRAAAREALLRGEPPRRSGGERTA